MAKKNTAEYERVLDLLENGLYVDKDGCVKRDDIEAMFIAISDKVKTETIFLHIKHMCKIKLLVKRSDDIYEINPKWKDLIKLYNKPF